MSKSRRQPAPARAPKPVPAPAGRSRVDHYIWIALALAILIIYAQTGNFDFNTYDDPLYVSANPHVQKGLSLDSIQYAFTAVVANNWTPVTLLSHILDVQFFGMSSGAHHLVNVFFHLLATLLLFAALERATHLRWPSAFVAAIFALHPLHVGSVAWISERKDVLSAFFCFLALYLYVRYAEQPDLRRYLAMTAAFTLGLLAKPMLVTFPFVLLLLDVWPLQRFRGWTSIKEKIPLFALSVAASIATYFSQKSTGALFAISPGLRIENSLISYVLYIGQTLWPAHTAVVYPYPSSIPWLEAAGALGILIAITIATLALFPTHRYLAVGWFWYLGTLVPVIGLVQVGLQSHADRYTYIPMVGLLLMIGFGAADFLRRWPASRRAIAAIAFASCAACIAVSTAQAAYWKDSETLFSHAIEVTRNNWVAEYNLGHYLMNAPNRGCAAALPHFQAALRMNPDYAEAHNNIGACLLNDGHVPEAISQFETALKLQPDFADADFNLAFALSKAGRSDDAIAKYNEALRLNPDHVEAQTNLGVLLVSLKRTAEAIPHFEAAVRLRPDYRNEYNLGAMLATVPGRQSEAIFYLEAAQRLHYNPAVAKIINQLRGN